MSGQVVRSGELHGGECAIFDAAGAGR